MEKEMVREEEEELAAPALEERQRRSLRGDNGVESHEAVQEKNAKEVEEEEEGGHRSVHLDQEEGIWKCRHCIWTYPMHVPGIDHIQNHEGYCNKLMAAKISLHPGSKYDPRFKGFNSADRASDTNFKIVDQFVAKKTFPIVKTDFEGKEQNFLPVFSVQTQNSGSKEIVVKNGSNVHLSAEIEEGNTTLQTEIEAHNVNTPAHSSNLQVTEIDVERVLEEQETHDLYCPNCHSCITKRVILRKRKRIVKEYKFDAKREKVQEVQPDVDVSSALPEITDEDCERNQEVFRCLSCFSFFIPTDGGFNIFRIFSKREESRNLRSSQQTLVRDTNTQQTPVSDTNWGSIFRTVMGKKKENGAGSSLLGRSSASPRKQVGDVCAKDLQDSQNDSLPESRLSSKHPADNSEKPSDLVKQNDKVLENPSTGDTHPKFEQKVDYPEPSVSGPPMLGQTQTTYTVNAVNDMNKRNDSGKELSKESYMSIGELGQNLDKNVPDMLSTCMPGARVAGRDDDISRDVNDITHTKASDAVIAPVADVTTELITQVTHVDVITQSDQPVPVSVHPAVVVGPQIETQIFIGDQGAREARRSNDFDILKSIIYGGLIESITSLGIVSSAAGSDASTLNIVALGLANLIGGLFVIAHDLSELQNEQQGTTDEMDKQAGRYWELLGRKTNFRLHTVVAVLSYIIFGLLPPIVYGFSFRKSDNKEYKLIAVAAASLVCIALLAIGKAHVRLQKDYIKCLSYYLGLGVAASGLSYVAGVMLHRVLEKLGLFNAAGAADFPAPPSLGFRGNGRDMQIWSSF